jgi:NADPH-dependent ferric siderophore reductase
MRESVRDRRDTFEPESRVSVVPGTLPVTEGTALEKETEIEVAQHQVSRPYTIPSRHERRKSS